MDDSQLLDPHSPPSEYLHPYLPPPSTSWVNDGSTYPFAPPSALPAASYPYLEVDLPTSSIASANLPPSTQPGFTPGAIDWRYADAFALQAQQLAAHGVGSEESQQRQQRSGWLEGSYLDGIQVKQEHEGGSQELADWLQMFDVAPEDSSSSRTDSYSYSSTASTASFSSPSAAVVPLINAFSSRSYSPAQWARSPVDTVGPSIVSTSYGLPQSGHVYVHDAGQSPSAVCLPSVEWTAHGSSQLRPLKDPHPSTAPPTVYDSSEAYATLAQETPPSLYPSRKRSAPGTLSDGPSPSSHHSDPSSPSPSRPPPQPVQDLAVSGPTTRSNGKIKLVKPPPPPPPPASAVVDTSQMTRYERRKATNRASAAAFRKRNKNLVSVLRQQVNERAAEIAQLKSDVQRLQAQNAALKQRTMRRDSK